MMTLGLNLLKSLWQKQANGITSLEMIQLIDLAREKSLSKGIIFTLIINIDKKNMELTEFDPKNEQNTSTSDWKNISEKNEENKSKSLFKSNLPSEIEEFYSTTGLKLSSPLIYMHFYPDGTADPIIIKYKEREKPFHFIPRNGGRGVFISDINNLNNEE